MPKLGNLRTAIIILTELQQHIRTKTESAATAAYTRRFAEARQILIEEIEYAKTQIKLAQTTRSKAKFKTKHIALYDVYATLEKNVMQLYDAMIPFKNEYDTSTRQNLTHEERSSDNNIDPTAIENERLERKRAHREIADRERLTLENIMKGMGHLRRATTLLTLLKQHIQLQTAAAVTAANDNRFAEASHILASAIIYADEQKKQAQTERDKSKNKTKHAELILAYPGLKMEIEQLYGTMATLKQRYIESELQRLAAIKQTPAKKDHRPHPHTLAAKLRNKDDLELDVEFDDALEEEYDEENDYQAALTTLLRLKTKNRHPGLDKSLKELIAHIKKLKQEGKEATSELTEALTKTYQRLTDRITSERYNAYANTVQGKPSIELRILGGLMLALGLATIVLGATVFPVGIGIAASITTSCTGLFLSAGGIGFFAMNRQKGLSKAMSNVNEATLLVDTEETQVPRAASAA